MASRGPSWLLPAVAACVAGGLASALGYRAGVEQGSTQLHRRPPQHVPQAPHRPLQSPTATAHPPQQQQQQQQQQPERGVATRASLLKPYTAGAADILAAHRHPALQWGVPSYGELRVREHMVLAYDRRLRYTKNSCFVTSNGCVICACVCIGGMFTIMKAGTHSGLQSA